MINRYAIVIFLSVCFVISATAEVLIVKTMNYSFDVDLPVFNTVVMNCYLPFQLIIYYIYRRIQGPKGGIRPLTWNYTWKLSLISILSTVLNLFRYFALNSIPGSIYVMVGTADITFNTLLSRIFLKKTFTYWHYLSGLLATSAIVYVSTNTDSAYGCNGSCFSQWAPGIFLTLAGALLAAITSVWSEVLMRGGPKEDSSYQALAEIGIFYSMWAFILTPAPLFITSEQTKWTPTLTSLSRPGLFATLCVGLFVAKLGFRTFKFGVIGMKSAFFFSILNSFKTIFTIVATIVVLDEPFTFELGIGLPCVFLAMGCYLYGSYLNKKTTDKTKKPDPTVMVVRSESFLNKEAMGSSVQTDGSLSIVISSAINGSSSANEDSPVDNDETVESPYTLLPEPK